MHAGPGTVEHSVRGGRIVVAAQVDPIQKIGGAGYNDRCIRRYFVGAHVVVVGGFSPVGVGHNRFLRVADRVTADGYMAAASPSGIVKKNPSRRVAITGVAIQRIDIHIIGHGVVLNFPAGSVTHLNPVLPDKRSGADSHNVIAGDRGNCAAAIGCNSVLIVIMHTAVFDGDRRRSDGAVAALDKDGQPVLAAEISRGEFLISGRHVVQGT